MQSSLLLLPWLTDLNSLNLLIFVWPVFSPSHFYIHLNQIQYVPLKCWNKPSTLHSVKSQKTSMILTYCINFSLLMHLRRYEKQLNFLSIVDSMKLSSDLCAFQLVLDTVSFLLGLGHLEWPFHESWLIAWGLMFIWWLKLILLSCGFWYLCNMLGRTLVTLYQTR